MEAIDMLDDLVDEADPDVSCFLTSGGGHPGLLIMGAYQHILQ